MPNTELFYDPLGVDFINEVQQPVRDKTLEEKLSLVTENLPKRNRQKKVKFYSNSTINSMWNEIDVLLTANPTLLLDYPKDKMLIKYRTEYNEHIPFDNTINTIKELDAKLKTLEPC
jgi:hypothetical protein